MNKNSTHQPIRNFTGKVFNSVKTVLVCSIIMTAFCNEAKAQNTDLPNPDPNLRTAPAGSFIIAMDNTNQGNAGVFNLKAYGLIITLINNDKKLRWIITAGKGKDGIDITVPAFSITNPVVVTASSKITVTNGSNICQVANITGTLQVGMRVTANGVPVGATIASINSATQITLTANATSNQNLVNATYQINTYPVSTYDFKAGPFIIYAADTAGVMAIVNSFNSTQSAAKKVKIYCTTTATTVDVRYNMSGLRPSVAIVNDGGNANIHTDILENASVPVANYTVIPSAAGLTLGCYTFASEPHNGSQGVFIDSIKNYVMAGGNFLAQCHAITTYENWTNGHFQTTGGFNNQNVGIGTNINYQNNDLSYAQYEGIFDANQGGNTQNWTLSSGSTLNPNFFVTVRGTGALANNYGASGVKLVTGGGGLVYFLGNHDYKSTTRIEEVNGQRMYLNAVLTPSKLVGCSFNPLPVHLKYFAAKKMNNGQVQINWATATEQNAKEFIIERSADGIHFSALARVAAVGNSNIEVNYNTLDIKPLTGKNFYRMLQTDLDGAKVYSYIILINMNISGSSIDIFPNPAKGVASINLNNLPLHNNSISVFDISGKAVINRQSVSGSTVKLNISSLQAGNYFVKVLTEDGTVLQQKLVVIK